MDFREKIDKDIDNISDVESLHVDDDDSPKMSNTLINLSMP
jgi:hypothetical protein